MQSIKFNPNLNDNKCLIDWKLDENKSLFSGFLTKSGDLTEENAYCFHSFAKQTKLLVQHIAITDEEGTYMCSFTIF